MKKMQSISPIAFFFALFVNMVTLIVLIVVTIFFFYLENLLAGIIALLMSSVSLTLNLFVIQKCAMKIDISSDKLILKFLFNRSRKIPWIDVYDVNYLYNNLCAIKHEKGKDYFFAFRSQVKNLNDARKTFPGTNRPASEKSDVLFLISIRPKRYFNTTLAIFSGAFICTAVSNQIALEYFVSSRNPFPLSVTILLALFLLIVLIYFANRLGFVLRVNRAEALVELRFLLRTEIISARGLKTRPISENLFLVCINGKKLFIFGELGQNKNRLQ